MTLEHKPAKRIFTPVLRRPNGEPIVPSSFSNDRLRGWKLKVLCQDGTTMEAIVNPSEYDAILRDPKVKSVEILDFGFFNQKEP